MSALTVTRNDVKQLSVYLQGLHQRPETNTSEDLKQIIEKIGLLQLDSISVVARSHYLVMLARAGLYNRADLDNLLDDGFLFEGWAHVACQIPMAHFPYYHANIQQKQLNESKWHLRKLGEDAEDAEKIISQTLETIRENGPMSSKDFNSNRKQAGGWWNWKPSKVALEYLFDQGELMVAHRKKFQRYYDLTERVLDGKNLTLDKTIDDYYRWAVEQGLKRVGIGTIEHISDYYREPKKLTLNHIQEMTNAGQVQVVEVDGWKETAYIHQDNMALLEQIRAGEHAPQNTVFLSPFDNLFWNRDRDEILWDFYYRIEVYTPKPKRVYGYYVLPILHKGELVGRIDPKVDRKKKHLIIHALHLEDTTEVTDDLTQGLIGAFEEFMAFHGCETMELGKCKHATLRNKIRKHFK